MFHKLMLRFSSMTKYELFTELIFNWVQLYLFMELLIDCTLSEMIRSIIVLDIMFRALIILMTLTIPAIMRWLHD